MDMALLDVSALQIKKRLHRRFSTPQRIRNLKKVTGLTVTECIKENIQHAKTLRGECKKYKCKVFNTSTASPDSTVKKVVAWVKEYV